MALEKARKSGGTIVPLNFLTYEMELDSYDTYKDENLLEEEREYVFRKVKLRKGKKLQKALLEWYKIKYGVMIPRARVFCDGVVLRKNPAHDDGSYLIIEIETVGKWIFKRVDRILVYQAQTKTPLQPGDKITLHLPDDQILNFKPYDLMPLEELDFLICRYLGREPKIHKKRLSNRKLENFLESRNLLKK